MTTDACAKAYEEFGDDEDTLEQSFQAGWLACLTHIFNIVADLLEEVDKDIL